MLRLVPARFIAQHFFWRHDCEHTITLTHIHLMVRLHPGKLLFSRIEIDTPPVQGLQGFTLFAGLLSTAQEHAVSARGWESLLNGLRVIYDEGRSEFRAHRKTSSFI